MTGRSTMVYSSNTVSSVWWGDCMSASPGRWKIDAIAAAEQWLTLARGASGQQQWKPLGKAAVGSEPGWLMLDRRGAPVKPETLNDPCFAGDRGPDRDTAYPVEVFREVDGVLLLKEPASLSTANRTVWVKNTSEKLLVEKLLTGLRESGATPIADAFAEHRLAKVVTSGIPAPPGLLGAQIEAYRACLSPGVRLVWGPPGTGKTRVLARAIEDLVKAGKRVLLVSTANVAVDNALHAVVTAMRPGQGTAIRVGPPHLAEIANNPNVRLEQLAGNASRRVDDERLAIEQELAGMDAIEEQVSVLSERVSGFDPNMFHAATRRIDNERQLQALNTQSTEVKQLWEAASGRAAAQRTAAQHARNEADRIAPAAAALRKIDDLTEQLRGLDLGHESKRAELASAELRIRGTTGWLGTRRAKRARDQAAQDLESFERLAVEHRSRLVGLIAMYQEHAGPITRERVERVEADLTTAHRAVEQAAQVEASLAARLRGLRAQLQAMRDAGLATSDDQDYVHRCLSDDLPAAYERLQQARAQQRHAASGRGALEERHRRLVDRSRKLRQDAERALIEEARVVATTLARSRLNRAVATSRFDVVLVDEAGAATLVEVLLALCRATTTAVLFGDFLQLPPVQDQELRRSKHSAVQRWVLPNPFTHANIHTATDAIKHSACISLLHQFRFGSGLRRLANEVIYEILRDGTELPGVAASPNTDIVFVDTSGLAELAHVRRPDGGQRGWWPAGLILGRALAEHHLPEDGEVGIVTPYTHQRDATVAGLRDRGLVSGVSVGTVHAFQGREIPTVVFDLVEDGHGWIARARRDGGTYEDNGVRLFGVGITRAQHRLYLVGNWSAVRTAARGPLTAVRRASQRELIQKWSGAALLGMPEPSPQHHASSVFSEVSEKLRQLVTVSDITDEKTFHAELERALGSANRRIWMWSPWISTRAGQVIPLISAAASRGVDVHVFLRPDEDRNMAREWAQRWLPELDASGATVIRSDHEHRKIVVLDEQTVLFGSLNVLSSSLHGNTRESMLTLRGGEFARRLLEELRVRELGTPHPCSRCAQFCQVRRASGKRNSWSWYCTSCRTHEAVPEPVRHR